MAMRLKRGLTECGVSFLTDSVTNQQFPIFSEFEIAELSKEFLFERSDRIDEEHQAVRFCTSFATKEEAVDSLIEVVKRLKK